MKKILYTLLVSCFMSMALAADVDFSSVVKSTSMPSDAEIWAVVSKFNFDKEQKEAIFKETKRKLQVMYASKNTASTNAQLNQSLNKVKSDSAVNEYMDSSMKNEVLQGVSSLPSTASTKTQTSKTTTNASNARKEQFSSKSFKAQKQSK